MVYFETKNPILGKFWRENVGILYGHLEYFTVIWNILRPFVVLYGHLAMLWQFGMYIFPCFGSKLGQEKSGNPGRMQIGSDTRALDRFRNEMQFGNWLLKTSRLFVSFRKKLHSKFKFRREKKYSSLVWFPWGRRFSHWAEFYSENWKKVEWSEMCQVHTKFQQKNWNETSQRRISLIYTEMRWKKSSPAGLPDFSEYNIPKWGKIYQMAIKYTKYPQYIPNGRKIDQMAAK
jgi:hypothetical protein